MIFFKKKRKLKEEEHSNQFINIVKVSIRVAICNNVQCVCNTLCRRNEKNERLKDEEKVVGT